MLFASLAAAGTNGVQGFRGIMGLFEKHTISLGMDRDRSTHLKVWVSFLIV